MPPKRKAAAKAAAVASDAEPELAHEEPQEQSIPPNQTIYIKNLNERVKKPGTDGIGPLASSLL
jgi:hypothetical protein